jgi:hypothetical protein
MHVERHTLARMLCSHGEDELDDRVLSVTDDELKRIGELGECYAFSRRAMATGGSMGGARALPMATIDVLEGSLRDLRWPRSELEREMGWYDLSDAAFARDRCVSTVSKSCSPLHTPDLPQSRPSRRRNCC